MSKLKLSDMSVNAANKKHRWSLGSHPLTPQISFYTFPMLSLKILNRVTKTATDRVHVE